MGHLQVSSNLHDPMGRARFPGEAQTGKPNHKHAAGKASRTLGIPVLKRNLRVSSVKLKTTAYTSLVRPIMDYGTTAWDPYTNKNITKLELSHPTRCCKIYNKKL